MNEEEITQRIVRVTAFLKIAIARGQKTDIHRVKITKETHNECALHNVGIS